MVKNEVGNKYGRLVVLERAGSTKLFTAYWLCKCDCGNLHRATGASLRFGKVRSCGCLRNEKASNTMTTHGLCKSKLYRVWDAMYQRCKNPNYKFFKNYGGRGISICEEWLDAEAFCTWASANGYNELVQIDRIDNNQGYFPGNCRFVSRSINSINRRKRQDNNSGYVGVSILKNGKFVSQVTCKGSIKKGKIHLGTFGSAEKAVQARNAYIKKNNLPHKIQNV
jgi:hypothetical protein